MEIKVDKQITYTLILNEHEAAFLKAAMQNPLIKDEDIVTADLRKRFWERLDEAGVNV